MRMLGDLLVVSSSPATVCRRKCGYATGTVNIRWAGSALADVLYDPNDIQKAHFEFLCGEEVRESRDKQVDHNMASWCSGEKAWDLPCTVAVEHEKWLTDRCSMMAEHQKDHHHD